MEEKKKHKLSKLNLAQYSVLKDLKHFASCVCYNCWSGAMSKVVSWDELRRFRLFQLFKEYRKLNKQKCMDFTWFRM